jgi:hypothetical protein
MSSAETSMRISRETLAELSRFQRAIHARTADQALHALLTMKRQELLAAIYGSIRGRVSPFTEADRIDVDH